MASQPALVLASYVVTEVHADVCVTLLGSAGAPTANSPYAQALAFALANATITNPTAAAQATAQAAAGKSNITDCYAEQVRMCAHRSIYARRHLSTCDGPLKACQ